MCTSFWTSKGGGALGFQRRETPFTGDETLFGASHELWGTERTVIPQGRPGSCLSSPAVCTPCGDRSVPGPGPPSELFRQGRRGEELFLRLRGRDCFSAAPGFMPRAPPWGGSPWPPPWRSSGVLGLEEAVLVQSAGSRHAEQEGTRRSAWRGTEGLGRAQSHLAALRRPMAALQAGPRRQGRPGLCCQQTHTRRASCLSPNLTKRINKVCASTHRVQVEIVM